MCLCAGHSCGFSGSVRTVRAYRGGGGYEPNAYGLRTGGGRGQKYPEVLRM